VKCEPERRPAAKLLTQGGGAADRSQYRQAAGAIAEALMITDEETGSELVRSHAELIGRVTLMWNTFTRKSVNYSRTFVRARRPECW
jgi:hypothetical protein